VHRLIAEGTLEDKIAALQERDLAETPILIGVYFYKLQSYKEESGCMIKPIEAFDRDLEWSELTRFVADVQPGPTLGIVSGRRRQGKTYLLEAA
jgi:hypothetical protein